MNLFELLKQFKTIEPDPVYKDQSKRAIFAARELVDWSPRKTILRIIETGVAFALAGFFIFIIAGGFSGSSLAPVQYSAIDPQSLRAEAQAIDMQIQLANLNYAESSAESTPSGAAALAPATIAAPSPLAAAGTSSTSTATSTSNASSTVSIDQALEKLSN